MLRLSLHGPLPTPRPEPIHATIEKILAAVHPAPDVTPLAPLPLTFDEAAARLQAIPQCFFEPDGAFLIRFPPRGPAWCVEGELYDNGQRLHYVALRIRCDREAPLPKNSSELPLPFAELLPAFGWPHADLTVQWVESGLVATIDDFLTWFRNWTRTPASGSQSP